MSFMSTWQARGLPFGNSSSVSSLPFELIHCDVWTSPVASVSGAQYYLVILDDFTHFCWTFPLVRKSEVATHIINFCAYVHKQFSLPIKVVQADNRTEFVNNALTTFFASSDIHSRLSCPYTSSQNGKAERIIRSPNDMCRTLLIHAHMPPKYWAEALATATYLLNRRPCSAIDHRVPFEQLHQQPPDYTILRVFGCLCYPNLTATSKHKLAPRSTAYVFLGYPSSHKGYRCLDLTTRRIIISRHVVFDEMQFPFSADPTSALPSSLDFLVTGHTVPVPRTAATTPHAVAPSPADVEQPQHRAHLEELAEDPTILQIGQVLAPAPAQPAPAGPPPLRVYTRRCAAAQPPPPELEVPPSAPAVAAQTAPAVPAQPTTVVSVQPAPASAVAAPSIPLPSTSSRPVTQLQTGSLKPVDRYGFPPTAHLSPSPLPRRFPVTTEGALRTPNGARLWLKSTRRLSKPTPGASFPVHPVPT
jgi:hypothetical protein